MTSIITFINSLAQFMYVILGIGFVLFFVWILYRISNSIKTSLNGFITQQTTTNQLIFEALNEQKVSNEDLKKSNKHLLQFIGFARKESQTLRNLLLAQQGRMVKKDQMCEIHFAQLKAQQVALGLVKRQMKRVEDHLKLSPLQDLPKEGEHHD